MPRTVERKSCRLGVVMAGLFGVCLGSAEPPQNAPRRVEGGGIENLFQLSDRLYSGGQPETGAGFATLKRLGIRTVLSVDGLPPDLEAAHAAGLRYVHIPVGYDGITPDEASRIVKAIQALPGPYFIHCHHGKHRGPAAAALACQATERWDATRALAWLKEAGTSPQYPGLFRSVREFRPPDPAALARIPEAFPERVPPPPLVGAMGSIDELWDHLMLFRAAGFGRLPDHPDLSAPHEATLLAEKYRELARGSESAKRGEDFRSRLASAAKTAEELSRTLSMLGSRNDAGSREAALAVFDRAAKDCTGCHARHRNP